MKTGVIIFLMCISVSLADTRQYFIQADIANVRAEPKTNAKIIGKLHINTRFIARDNDPENGFLYVTGVHESSIEGWVHESICGRASFNSGELGRMAQKGDLPTRIKWAERYAALVPDEVEPLQILEKLYTQSGDTVKHEWVSDKLAGTVPMYVAIPWNGSLIVAGVLGKGGTFQSLVFSNKSFTSQEDDVKTINRLQQICFNVAGIPWFQNLSPLLLKESPYRYTTFPKPEVRTEGNLNTEEEVVYAISLKTISPHESTVYFSQPVKVIIAPKGLQKNSTIESFMKIKKKIEHTGYRHGVLYAVSYQYFPENGFADVMINSHYRAICDRKMNVLWPASDDSYLPNTTTKPYGWYIKKLGEGKERFSINYAVISNDESFTFSEEAAFLYCNQGGEFAGSDIFDIYHGD